LRPSFSFKAGFISMSWLKPTQQKPGPKTRGQIHVLPGDARLI